MGSCVGVFYTLERESGRVRWRHDVSGDSVARQFHGDALLTDDLVVIGTDADSGRTGLLFAFERATGAPRWTLAAGRGVASDIARHGGRGYAVSLEDELLCFDLASGRVLWRFATGAVDEERRMPGAPALAGDRVCFVGLDGVAYALDADSGRVVWKRDLGAAAATWPVVVGGTLAFVARDDALYRLDSASGAVVSRVPLPGGPYHRPAAIAEDSLLVLLGPHSVACVAWPTGRVRWRKAALREWSSSRPYLWRGAVLAGSEDGELRALELADGATRWSHRLPGMIRGIGAADSVLYVGTFQGRVHALKVAR